MKKLFLYIVGGIIILTVISLYITSMNSRSEVDVNSKELKNYAPKFFVEVAKITYPENSEIILKLTTKKFSKPCAFDVLENHKHIDMSAEPLLINLISNILDDSYQNDAYSEIEKAPSHNNVPIIITNSFDNRFDDTDMSVIKIPFVAREISLLSYVILFKKLVF